mmetsp:Transcript_7778/g.25637  ORF Transcript_7778/g.25637 Transcript_7778/m.25637 type:complete len:310 (+) Transcript_7778:3-932(+)
MTLRRTRATCIPRSLMALHHASASRQPLRLSPPLAAPLRRRFSSVPPPVAALVPPGECQFGEEWVAAPLLGRADLNHDTRLFTFGLPDPGKPLGLSTCACILARGGAEGAEPVVRPYTPVSTNALLGKFELMVKVYSGGLSAHLDGLPIGAPVAFKHIQFNVKTQYPFGRRRLGMLAGGTGIAPMIQALHAVLGSADDSTVVDLLYGSKTEPDILARDTLDAWSAAYPGRLNVTHVLSHEPAGSAWAGARGFISEPLLRQALTPPDADSALFVCGPPPMYDLLCGPRGEEELTGLLADMGYTAGQVHKF